MVERGTTHPPSRRLRAGVRALPGAPRPRRRVALYGHDTQGLGHLRRNLALAEVLAGDGRGGAGADVLVLTGAPEAGLFPRPPGVDVVVLPGVRKDADGGYAPRALRSDLADVVGIRSALLTTALTSFAPDLLVVDKAPWGFRGELAGVLPALRRRGARAVLGLRDVLDDPASAAAQWAADGGDDAVRRCYDEVWVYGDVAVHDLPAAARMAPDVAARAVHVGYLAEGRVPGADAGARPPVPTARWVLGVVGGGQDGAPLARALAGAPAPAGTTLVLVAGPQLPEDDLRALRRRAGARDDLHVVRFSLHSAAWAAGAAAVVAMGGANTVAELLATDVPALVVPRTRPRREQEVRARALEARGALEVLLPDEVTPGRLGAWLAGAVDRRTDRSGLALDGLRAVAERAARHLPPAGPWASALAAAATDDPWETRRAAV
ncbi:glycosyltransferase [Pseudokineococcus sp. 5B2Z-1]|uniref:glycosyltransferase family protein n=1 Tax=Pseudokineococcus sp. 5B2Z-1 TaxID=3132744 RepID=UPI0030B5CD49